MGIFEPHAAVQRHVFLARQRELHHQHLAGLAGRRVDQALLDLVDPGIRQQRNIEIRGLLGLVVKPQAGGDLGHGRFLRFDGVRPEDERNAGRSDSGFEIFLYRAQIAVIARSAATKQSSLTCGPELLRFARNDGQHHPSGRDRRRHGQERARDVPEQLPVGRQRHGMGGAGQDDELAVAVRQQIEELLDVGDGGDAVIFAAHQQHRRQHLVRNAPPAGSAVMSR